MAGSPRSGSRSRARHRARSGVELAESAVVVDPSVEIRPDVGRRQVEVAERVELREVVGIRRERPSVVSGGQSSSKPCRLTATINLKNGKTFSKFAYVHRERENPLKTIPEKILDSSGWQPAAALVDLKGQPLEMDLDFAFSRPTRPKRNFAIFSRFSLLGGFPSL